MHTLQDDAGFSSERFTLRRQLAVRGGRCNKSTSTDGGNFTQSICGMCETGTSYGCGDAGACTSPDVCSWSSVGGYACVTPAAEGGACGNSLPCAIGLFCKDGICTKRLQAGAACTSSNECDSLQGLSCIDMTCQLPTFVGPGEMCASLTPRCIASDCITSFADGGISRVYVAQAATTRHATTAMGLAASRRPDVSTASASCPTTRNADDAQNHGLHHRAFRTKRSRATLDIERRRLRSVEALDDRVADGNKRPNGSVC